MAYSSNKGRGFIPAQTTEEKLLQRRAADMVKAVLATGQPRFTAFLSDREQQLCLAQLATLRPPAYRLYGGFENAERKMLCVFEDTGESPAFPIVPIHIDAEKANRPLTHRDYLGSVLGLGLARECIGDILVSGTGAVAYVQETVAPFCWMNCGM